MTPERHQQLRNLFEAALERPAGQREAFLDAACSGDADLRQEARRLLAAHESTTRLIEDCVTPAIERTDPLSREGRRIGPYEILREIGKGGMGTVYLARRADEAFERLVAVKVLRADLANEDLIRRFQREREILAALDHPHVTRLLDAGTTEDKLPYFVMEYVEGESLLGYCDQGCLSLPDRLHLFQQVCEAVGYAHRCGVIHRDLKPSNIMVSNGTVKVLDFGIARLVRGDAADETLTVGGMLMMTPQYASPEQVRGEPATWQSDVYALGVILYELLTGHSPYHLRSRVLHEIIRVICEENPTRPSTVISTPIEVDPRKPEGNVVTPPETAGRLRRATMGQWKDELRGDLDAIILKALAKQPAERYRSPELLREDLGRHLQGERITAREISWWQHLRSVLSRHPGAIIGAAGLAAAVMTGAIKLHASAFFYALGGGWLFLFWYAAVNREFGRRLAGSFLTGRVLVAIMWVMAFLPMLIVARHGRMQVVDHVASTVVFPVLAAAYLSAFALRAGWSGPLLLDISSWSPVVVTMAVAMTMAAVFGGEGKKFEPERLLQLATVLTFYIGGRREVRQAGILEGGGLIPWANIESWSWVDDPKLLAYANLPIRSFADENREFKYLLLKLQLRRRFQLTKGAMIRVDRKKRTEVEQLMRQYQSDWPE